MGNKNSQTTPATTSTTPRRQLLQTAHPATSNTAPTRQPLGSANAETTLAEAPAAALTERDPTHHAKGRKGGCPGPRKETTTRRNVTQGGGAGATPGGTRASTADKEERRSKAGEATRTGNRNGGDGRACAWEAATTKGMAWPASPVATGCQGNPCSTGIRWGVSPAAQMRCLRNRSGSPLGADQP